MRSRLGWGDDDQVELERRTVGLKTDIDGDEVSSILPVSDIYHPLIFLPKHPAPSRSPTNSAHRQTVLTRLAFIRPYAHAVPEPPKHERSSLMETNLDNEHRLAQAHRMFVRDR